MGSSSHLARLCVVEGLSLLTLYSACFGVNICRLDLSLTQLIWDIYMLSWFSDNFISHHKHCPLLLLSERDFWMMSGSSTLELFYMCHSAL